MGNKLITDAGKTELLRLGFSREEAGGAFKYIALGGANSQGSTGGEFKEVSGSNYERVKTEADVKNKTITITGTFNEENYAPVDGEGLIKEIGLCNNDVGGSEKIFFLFSDVAEVYKTGDISLEYTIIISID